MSFGRQGRFKDIASAFPLFIKQPELISMLDATLDQPFFKRTADSNIRMERALGVCLAG